MKDQNRRVHRHTATLDDTFDFLNTDSLDGSGHRVEELAALTDATGWLAEHGLLHREEARRIEALPRRRAEDSLMHVRAARAAMREIVEALVAARPADPAALEVVNAVLRARTVPELVVGDGSPTVGHRHVGEPLDGALAGLAEPLIVLVTAGEVDRLRICANDGCRWVFHDTSPTGRRRWCSMASCGNRAKAARHRARKRGPVPAGETIPAEVRSAG